MNARDVQTCEAMENPNKSPGCVPGLCPENGDATASETEVISPNESSEQSPFGQLSGSGRDALGRWLPGNIGALKHGARSAQVKGAMLPEQADALIVLAERRREIEADLGGAGSLSALTRDLIGRYLELGVIADFLATNILQHGPLTTKGNQRAAVSAFTSVVDRQQRIATALGLERRARDVTAMSVEEYLKTQGTVGGANV